MLTPISKIFYLLALKVTGVNTIVNSQITVDYKGNFKIAHLHIKKWTIYTIYTTNTIYTEKVITSFCNLLSILGADGDKSGFHF